MDRPSQQAAARGIRSYQLGDRIRLVEEADVGAVPADSSGLNSNRRDRDGGGAACARSPVGVRGNFGFYWRLLLLGASQRSGGVVGVIVKQMGVTPLPLPTALR